ncbi:MAG: ATP-binding protein, partial [Thermodesulfovibrionales bacterium]|nr:ATP-binding protein [Thermodesulfovibrionales bacterium]
IIYSLLTLFTLFTLGAGITMLYIYRTTSDLQSVINLHRVEIIRQDLVINAQTVQTHLYTIGTVFGQELDVIVDNVMALDDSVDNCLGCHHTEEMTARLNELKADVEQFKGALSSFVTTSANKERVERLRLVSIAIGSSLLTNVQEMAIIANHKLNSKTIAAIRGINNSRIILILTLILSFFIAVAIAIGMTRQITEPIYELVNATRKIKAGELGYTTPYKGKSEFGELVFSFNDMSSSLKESNRTILHNLHSLSNLYNTTLTFHAVTNEIDIYREISHGAAGLVGAEQCGIMMLKEDNFVHMPHAVGLDADAIGSLRIPKEGLMKFYGPTKKRAYIINTGIGESPAPETDKRLAVRNLMFVWVRHKGEPIGAIRLANKKSGDFTEEDVRLLAILANNVSVAIENIRLYDNLRMQMSELKDTQEQLVQAAKLAAIGELASNVAHEINNPLTSILGYAELIKEEDDIANIMRDVDIIEKESLRAREIVRQLLEFSRKRPLSVREIDITGLLKDVIELVSLQLKDTAITVSENYGGLPVLTGDANQLKQVFLNIINNAIYAMQDKGVLGVRTYATGGSIFVEISDTGKGIPKEIISKMFEPFFTTKKEHGTGLGLSISYKIVQSHNGKIEVESEENLGSKFTVVLPAAGVNEPLKTAGSET